MQSIVQGAAKIAGDAAIKGARMYTVKYGPVAAAAGELFMIAANGSREFVREAALAQEWPLSREEYETLQENSELRVVRVCCQTIRASREAFDATGIDSPISLFSHWRLDVGDLCYELREHKVDQQPRNQRSREILHQQVGLESRNIKLEITTNRTSHPSSKYIDVGMTKLDDQTIIQIASKIFDRFGTGYDLFVDNCQHFSQLLAEAICGEENKETVRKFFDKRSVMKLPVAASWFVAPVYGATRALHYGLRDTEDLQQPVQAVLEKMENLYYHPRVLAARRQNILLF